MTYEDVLPDDDEMIGIACPPDPFCPPEVVQDRLDGNLTNDDIVVYVTIGHFAYQGLRIESWGQVARSLDMPTPKLLASLDRLTKAGWATWQNPDDYLGLSLLVTKRPGINVHAEMMRLMREREAI